MWFSELMDCFKQGIKSTNENKGVLIPIFFNIVINFILIIPIMMVGVVFFATYSREIKRIVYGHGNILRITIPLTIIVIVFLLIYTALKTLLEVGSINIYVNAIDNVKPTPKIFFDGVKKYFGRVFITKIIIYVLLLILSIPIVTLGILYISTIGILTAGWGVIFGSVIIGIYFSTWVIAIITDNLSGYDGVITSLKFGQKNFWMLFIFLFTNAMMIKYIATAFGGLIAIAGGWVISLILLTYFKMILVAIYKSKHKEILN